MQTKEIQIIKTGVAAILLLLTGASFFLTACGNTPENRVPLSSPVSDTSAHSPACPVNDGGDLLHSGLPESPDPGALSPGSTAQDAASQSDSPFHSVPYFHDDTGRCIQSLDGYLYGYWNGRLCRYDSDTLKQDCYFTAASNQSGQFCIYGDNLFFLERPHTASLTNADTCLYMTDLGGRERKLLTSQVPNRISEYIDYDDYYIDYRIDIYDDIIYLMGSNDQNRIYYRLNQEHNAVTRVEESETLYGLLPAGYREPLRYSRLPSLPYQMRHYGYLFLMDGNGKLAAYDVESGRLEQVAFPTDNISMDSVFLTHDALYCAETAEYRQPLTTWYRISLDDLQTSEKWGQFSPLQGYMGGEIFYDESGAYFVEKDGSVVSLCQIPWDGSSMTLLYSRYLEGGEYFQSPAYDYPFLYYTDGDFFYFNDKKDSQYCVMRAMLYGNAPEAQVVAVYDEDFPETLFAYDTLEHSFTTKADTDGETDTFSCDISFTKLLLTEDTAGSRAINAYLANVYEAISRELEDFETGFLSDSESWPLPGMGSYMLVDTYANYLDERYIGITISRDTYYSGAAHPNTWSEEYVFDRRTGKRIAITDIVENSVDEICEIISAYVEMDHPGFRQGQDYRDSILEDFRFFLSEEGIGILFNTYELGSYAEGPDDYIIPFREFDLKPDTGNL